MDSELLFCFVLFLISVNRHTCWVFSYTWKLYVWFEEMPSPIILSFFKKKKKERKKSKTSFCHQPMKAQEMASCSKCPGLSNLLTERVSTQGFLINVIKHFRAIAQQDQIHPPLSLSLAHLEEFILNTEHCLLLLK